MDEQVRRLSKAVDGVILYMVGHGNLGVIGIAKEMFAAQKGMKDIDEGPAKELLNAVVEYKSGTGSEEDTIDLGTRDSEKFKTVGRELLNEAKPTIQALDSGSAGQVTQWLHDIGLSVAEAAKEKGEREKVNPQEEQALRDIQALFA